MFFLQGHPTADPALCYVTLLIGIQQMHANAAFVICSHWECLRIPFLAYNAYKVLVATVCLNASGAGHLGGHLSLGPVFKLQHNGIDRFTLSDPHRLGKAM